MKVIAINGSCRNHGNTFQIIDLVVENLNYLAAQENIPLTVEIVQLGKIPIEQCRGCRVCFDRGESLCPIKDGFLQIKERLQSADGLILASPVYVDDVSGPLKTWIDRMAHVCHRPEFAGKTTCLLTTSGSMTSQHAMGTMSNAVSTWGFGISAKGEFRMGELMKPEQTRAAFQDRSREIASRFWHALRSGKPVSPSFRSLLTFSIQQRCWQKAAPERYDTKYWRTQGWLETKCTYYYAHQASIVKVKLAQYCGLLIDQIFHVSNPV